MVTVRLFADLREAAETGEVEVESSSAADAVEKLVERYPELEDRLYTDGELRPHINLTADGEPVDGDEEVGDVDELAVFPPVSGGLL